MQLPTLYKRTTVGKIQEWTIEVVDDKFRTISGQQDGKKITNNWTTCYPKNVGKANATTGELQAQNEASAKHQKKVESGYRHSISNIDKKKFYEPMLAQDFKNKNRNATVMNFLNGSATAPAIFSQPKLDGIRCIAMREGLFTRTGKKITACPHISVALEDFFEKYPNATLDGELYNHKYKDDFNQIIHLVRKQNLTDEHLMESRRMIQYHIYDAPVIGNGKYLLTEKDTFSDRTSTLDAAFAKMYHQVDEEVDFCPIVKTTEIHDREQLDRCYEDYVEAGYEGQMVRIDGPYENKRSAKLLKRKDFIDEEYKILGYEEGKGNRSGTIKHFKFESKTGKPFNSNVKGTFEYLADLLQNAKSLVGKQATIKYFNLTPDGVPRFPYVIAIRDYE
jgi:DNA ligase-1